MGEERKFVFSWKEETKGDRTREKEIKGRNTCATAPFETAIEGVYPMTETFLYGCSYSWHDGDKIVMIR